MDDTRDAQASGSRGRLPLRIAAVLGSTYIGVVPLRQIASAWRVDRGGPPALVFVVFAIGCVLVVAGLALAVSRRRGGRDLALVITAQLAYALLVPTRWHGM